MSSYSTVPRISVTMVSLPSDLVEELSIDHRTTGQKPVPPRIDTAQAQNTIWYESESSSSSDSESDEDNEREDDTTPPPRRRPEPCRPAYPLPPHSHLTHPKLRKPRSPFSPLRNSFTAPDDNEHVSPSSNSSLPEDKKGLDKERFDGLLRASRERRAILTAGMRIQTTGLNSPPAPRVTSPNHSATSARRTMDLRKEITLKVHAAKHEERRQTFLARLLASPSSSPTTLTTPVTPPDSPAEFHYTLPSPGLVSPLALFETLGINSSLAGGAREGIVGKKEGGNAFERVERVNWAHETKHPPLDDDQLRSPSPSRSMVGGGGAGAMSLGMGVDSLMRTREAQAQRKAPQRWLPIGAGRLQIPNTGLHAKRPTVPAALPPLNLPLNGRTAPLSPRTKPATATLNGNADGKEATATVVVLPRRSASLVRLDVPGPVIAPISPTTTSHSRHPPSLTEITERLNVGKPAADVKIVSPVAPRRRPDLAPFVVRVTPATTATTGEQRLSARAAAFPDFLRERQRQGQQQRHGTSVTHVERSTAAGKDVVNAKKPAAPIPSAAEKRDDSVLVLPPARPKSVDAALQERVRRGNAMMAKLSVGHHRRRKSESAIRQVPGLNLNVRAPPTGGRDENGWF